MLIDSNAIVTATEANQNFSRVSRLAEQRGHVVVFKNNSPKLLIIDLDREPQIEMTEDEKKPFHDAFNKKKEEIEAKEAQLKEERKEKLAAARKQAKEKKE